MIRESLRKTAYIRFEGCTPKTADSRFKPVVSVSVSIYRYYSPQIGKWLSRDPIEEEGGYNLYAMVDNDPVNWWDYLGLKIVLEYRKGQTIVDATKKQFSKINKKLAPRDETEILSKYGFEVFWEGDEDKLLCPDSSNGEVVFLQYLYEAKRKLNWLLQTKLQGYWAADDHGNSWVETCNKHKNGHKRQPAQTDPQSKTGSEIGAAIHATHGEGSYYDPPTLSQVIKIEAYLRCKCEDDQFIETRYFFYKSFGNEKEVNDGQKLKEYTTEDAAIKEGDDWAIRTKLPKSLYK